MHRRLASLMSPFFLVSLAACLGKTDEDDGDEDDETVYTGPCPQVDLGSRVGESLATGSTRGADNDWGDCGAAPSDGSEDSASDYASAPDVSLAWTAPDSGRYTAHTNGSRFDTLLTLIEGGCSGEVIECDDDGGRELDSAIVFEAEAGREYVFIIDGYSGDDDGDWKFSIETGNPSWWGDSGNPEGPSVEDVEADGPTGAPTVRTAFGAVGVELHVDGGPGGWWLGVARTGDPADSLAFLADCHSGALVDGTWHSACQPMRSDRLQLRYGGDPRSLERGTTHLRLTDADRVTWVLESDRSRGGDGRCFVWGHRPAVFAHLHCQEL